MHLYAIVLHPGDTTNSHSYGIWDISQITVRFTFYSVLLLDLSVYSTTSIHITGNGKNLTSISMALSSIFCTIYNFVGFGGPLEREELGGGGMDERRTCKTKVINGSMSDARVKAVTQMDLLGNHNEWYDELSNI
ncbi:hypothetical protein ACJX0J_009265 [Zea mays]